VAQAAIAHVRFETIHPFVDGNGRTGRALIYMVLRRRGLAVRATPPISLVLATRAKAYVAALDATRVIGSEKTAAACAAVNARVAFFAAACVRAVADAERFEERVAARLRQFFPSAAPPSSRAGRLLERTTRSRSSSLLVSLSDDRESAQSDVRSARAYRRIPLARTAIRKSRRRSVASRLGPPHEDR